MDRVDELIAAIEKDQHQISMMAGRCLKICETMRENLKSLKDVKEAKAEQTNAA